MDGYNGRQWGNLVTGVRVVVEVRTRTGAFEGLERLPARLGLGAIRRRWLVGRLSSLGGSMRRGRSLRVGRTVRMLRTDGGYWTFETVEENFARMYGYVFLDKNLCLGWYCICLATFLSNP